MRVLFHQAMIPIHQGNINLDINIHIFTGSSGLVYPYLPSPNPEFVFNQNPHLVNYPSQISVYQQLRCEPKAAKQNSILPCTTSSKPPQGVRRKTPPKGELIAHKRHKRDIGPTTPGSVYTKDRAPANTSPKQQQPPEADTKVAKASLPVHKVTILQNVKERYKAVFESLSGREASGLLGGWMKDMNDGVSVAFDPPDCWPETEPFDLPEYLEEEAPGVIIKVLLHLVCGKHCRKVTKQKLDQLRNTMGGLDIQQEKKSELEKVMDLHKAAV
ncbi:uncharacterized protein N7498_007892 [Penicillium cinerascens]|uniref:Uncharacterized protein n=1 Tax=Penicillium cinerascens TaxID=70096 RepID=A0A9W9MDT2_9EURO|nr:uncharacterized protein N7498_007892 [Penicillium cinerascens]KAJ5198775.1 hypothetical protein N7498_007892 [Penicillium cinerascens]